MQNRVTFQVAVIGIAAAIVIPSAYSAYGRSYREDRAERPTLSISQNVDRADARIANLKADLRLTDDPTKNWSGLETALRDLATKRAKGEGDPRSGRSASDSTVASPAANQDADVAARRERDARANPQADDIMVFQREADALAAQSAALKQIADAAKPLYDTLDDRQRQRLVRFVNEDVHVTGMDYSPGQR
jgi:hypothetical protein